MSGNGIITSYNNSELLVPVCRIRQSCDLLRRFCVLKDAENGVITDLYQELQRLHQRDAAVIEQQREDGIEGRNWLVRGVLRVRNVVCSVDTNFGSCERKTRAIFERFSKIDTRVGVLSKDIVLEKRARDSVSTMLDIHKAKTEGVRKEVDTLLGELRGIFAKIGDSEGLKTRFFDRIEGILVDKEAELSTKLRELQAEVVGVDKPVLATTDTFSSLGSSIFEQRLESFRIARSSFINFLGNFQAQKARFNKHFGYILKNPSKELLHCYESIGILEGLIKGDLNILDNGIKANLRFMAKFSGGLEGDLPETSQNMPEELKDLCRNTEELIKQLTFIMGKTGVVAPDETWDFVPWVGDVIQKFNSAVRNSRDITTLRGMVLESRRICHSKTERQKIRLLRRHLGDSNVQKFERFKSELSCLRFKYAFSLITTDKSLVKYALQRTAYQTDCIFSKIKNSSTAKEKGLRILLEVIFPALFLSSVVFVLASPLYLGATIGVLSSIILDSSAICGFVYVVNKLLNACSDCFDQVYTDTVKISEARDWMLKNEQFLRRVQNDLLEDTKFKEELLLMLSYSDDAFEQKIQRDGVPATDDAKKKMFYDFLLERERKTEEKLGLGIFKREIERLFLSRDECDVNEEKMVLDLGRRIQQGLLRRVP